MMAAAFNKGGMTTMAVYNRGTQDRVVDHNGVGKMVARDARDSRMEMMAATVEDGGGIQ